MKEVITIKIKMVFKTPFDDLPNLSGKPIIFNISEYEEYIFLKEIKEEGIFLDVTGYFKIKVNEKRYSALLKKEEDGAIIYQNDPDGLVSSFLNENIDKCVNEIKRVFENIRWRFNISKGDHKEVLFEAFWSRDIIKWNKISYVSMTGIMGYASRYDHVTDDYFKKEIFPLIENKNTEEPIYQKMIRETQDLVMIKPKSAYMNAVSALEVATKAFIIRMKPDNDWLIQNIPSPDVLKIIKTYFPELAPNFRLPDFFFRRIKSNYSKQE